MWRGCWVSSCTGWSAVTGCAVYPVRSAQGAVAILAQFSLALVFPPAAHRRLSWNFVTTAVQQLSFVAKSVFSISSAVRYRTQHLSKRGPGSSRGGPSAIRGLRHRSPGSPRNGPDSGRGALPRTTWHEVPLCFFFLQVGISMWVFGALVFAGRGCLALCSFRRRLGSGRGGALPVVTCVFEGVGTRKRYISKYTAWASIQTSH